jgi:hypothetical protein
MDHDIEINWKPDSRVKIKADAGCRGDGVTYPPREFCILCVNDFDYHHETLIPA